MYSALKLVVYGTYNYHSLCMFIAEEICKYRYHKSITHLAHETSVIIPFQIMILLDSVTNWYTS